MGMLGNSTRGLLPLQKRLLYWACVVPIATYGFRLWYFSGAPTKAQVSLLATMQHKAALWILGAFRTSPTGGIEALAGLILFISISRSWPSAHVLGLLRFLLSMHYSLFLVLTTPRVLIPIHSLLLFSLMHRVLG